MRIAILSLFLTSCAGTYYTETMPDGRQLRLVHRGDLGILREEVDNGSGGIAQTANGELVVGRSIRTIESQKASGIQAGSLIIMGPVDYSSPDRAIMDGFSRIKRIDMIRGIAGDVVDGVVDLGTDAINKIE